MRKGFDGLSGIVRNALQKDPLTGDIFIFTNRRRNQIKLLLFEGDGFPFIISDWSGAPMRFLRVIKITWCFDMINCNSFCKVYY